MQGETHKRQQNKVLGLSRSVTWLFLTHLSDFDTGNMEPESCTFTAHGWARRIVLIGRHFLLACLFLIGKGSNTRVVQLVSCWRPKPCLAALTGSLKASPEAS